MSWGDTAMSTAKWPQEQHWTVSSQHCCSSLSLGQSEGRKRKGSWNSLRTHSELGGSLLLKLRIIVSSLRFLVFSADAMAWELLVYSLPSSSLEPPITIHVSWKRKLRHRKLIHFPFILASQSGPGVTRSWDEEALNGTGIATWLPQGHVETRAHPPTSAACLCLRKCGSKNFSI